MATEDYVPVAADDWYQRRRDDAEGKFFRDVSNQGPRKNDTGATRQGIYCFTADGKLLTYKNAGQAPDVMRETLRQGLREWKKLPEERRKPGSVKVDDLDKSDARYTRTPPPGGLIVNVYTRILDRDMGEFCKGTCKTLGGDKAARDHLWLTESEWKGLVPTEPKKGDKNPLPAKVAERILRFHLTDNTRGEPPMWRREDIRSQELTLTVEEVTPSTIRLRLDGSALLATNADAAKADRGFDVRLLGYIQFDRTKKLIKKFSVVAVGDHWGHGAFTGGARPGRQPLGVAFELSTGKSAADLVPPQAGREIDAYLGRGR
ncbi:MAG: hypothetical protein EXS09_18260 [Gemmataceae bacterium]|nr:hypothetical protein [Gemmataceae bacterium]